MVKKLCNYSLKKFLFAYFYPNKPKNMEKGYVAIRMREGKGFVVTDLTQLATVMNKHRNTLIDCFSKPGAVYNDGYWLVVKGYEHIKSARGKSNLKKE